MKRAFWVGLCVLGLGFPAGAQQINPSLDASYAFALYRPEIFNMVDGSTLIERLPVRTFLDGTLLPFSTALGRMGTAPLELPSLAFVSVTKTKKASASPARRTDGKDFETDGKDSPDDVMISQSNPLHYGGEVGAFYGAWSGKYSGDAMGTYMQGSVGNDKFQINVGASYQEWNVNNPRGRH